MIIPFIFVIYKLVIFLRDFRINLIIRLLDFRFQYGVNMGFINKTNWTRKKHKNKKTSSSINEDELNKDDVYDIETSDNEANETPTKWYDEVKT